MVMAAEINPALPAPDRIIGGARETRARAYTIIEITKGIRPGRRYVVRIPVSIPRGATAPTATVKRIDVPNNAPVVGDTATPGSGGAAVTSLSVDYGEVDCFGSRCFSGGPGQRQDLACTDPPGGCSYAPTIVFSNTDSPMETNPKATRSYLRIKIALSAIASLRDWRGEQSAASATVFLHALTVREV